MQTQSLFPDFVPTPKLTIEQIKAYCSQTRALGETPCTQTVINLIESGELKGVKARGTWLIPESSFRGLLERIEKQVA